MSSEPRSETLNGLGAVQQGRAAAAPGEPLGALRQARERAGLRVEALAATLKVPVRQLEALEAGRYDELPDPTFARALASSVCRVLKTDPGPILAFLPAVAPVRLGEPENALHTPIHRSMASSVLAIASPGPFQRLSAPVVVALLLLVVAIALWFVLPRHTPPTDSTIPVAPPAVVADPAARTQAAPAPPASPVPTPPVSPELPTAPAPPMPSPTNPAALPVPAPAAPTAASAPLLAPATQHEAVRLSAIQTAWVQVTGASGQVLLQRSLQPGESVVFNDDLPLQLVIGRADAVRVSVRGAPTDLNTVSRNNVARLQVR